MKKNILDIRKDNNVHELRNEMLEMNIVDIAQVFEDMDQHQLVRLFRMAMLAPNPHH